MERQKSNAQQNNKYYAENDLVPGSKRHKAECEPVTDWVRNYPMKGPAQVTVKSAECSPAVYLALAL